MYRDVNVCTHVFLKMSITGIENQKLTSDSRSLLVYMLLPYHDQKFEHVFVITGFLVIYVLQELPTKYFCLLDAIKIFFCRN